MSIKALHYITGDTQQSGFRCIGSSEAFPADDLPYLNNGETIQERARVESGSSHQGYGDNQILSHVWEYQTGRYGCPVMINTIVAISTGRAHAFSEYVAGIAGSTTNVAELASAGEMIAGTDSFNLLDVDTFMGIPGKDTIDCPEGEWIPGLPSGDPVTFNQGIDEIWKKTVLFQYWKQASIRAFSEDSPATVRVNLGDFSDDIQEDTEETIRQAKRFFAGVIVPGLPKQVQNIASMAAGVNGEDRCNLYSALEFDISFNMYAEETLQLRNPRDIAGTYRLNEAELDFISEVSSGKTPEVVSSFFARYRELTGKTEIAETRVPFMADGRVWYLLYCMDRAAREKGEFIKKANLSDEQGSRGQITDTRACFLLMRQLRRLLETDHHLNDENRSLVTDLVSPLESALLQVMLEDMKRDNATPFLLRRNEMVEFHRKMLYTVPDDQLDAMIELAVRDASVSKAPQFVRCYPSTPIRNDAADERNGKLLAALLPASIRKRIDEECKKETIEDKYLDELRSEDFADNWACLNHCVKTKEAVANFLREEIQTSRKHFLLYKISLKYLPENELLLMTLKHFTENHAKQNARPDDRQLKIAVHGAREFISNPSSVDAECVSAMNRYYQACFREYKGNIGNISQDIIRRLGGDTTEAMVLIFGEYTQDTAITPEEASAIFDAFGGENKALARREQVENAYVAMLKAQRDKALSSPDCERSRLIKWLGDMIAAAPFDVDTSDDMVAFINHATEGTRMTSDEAESLFTILDPEKKYAQADSVIAAYTSMLSVHQERMMQDSTQEPEAARENMIRWVANMAEKAPFRVDTSDSIRTVFESARTGSRISRASIQEIFTRLYPRAVSGEEKVKPAFQTMIRDQLDTSLKNKDESILEWVGNMVAASDGVFDFDTTEILKKIFNAAEEGKRMYPADAGVVFSSMAGKADGLNTTVLRAYTEMLSVRRKEAAEQSDEEGFNWLCDMADRSPWKDNAEWMAEQHTENVVLLCEISRNTGKPIDNTSSLGMARSWLDQGSLTSKGVAQLQKYCDEQLQKDNSVPAEQMLRSFTRIDESCQALRQMVFSSTVSRLLNGLEKPGASLALLIEECRPDVEKAGKRLDDLYNETNESADGFIANHFESTTDLNSLIEEQKQIPENCAFAREWQRKLDDKVFDQQISMFNAQPNLEKLKALKEDILKRSTRLQPALESAYRLIDEYEKILERMKDCNEYQAVTSQGRELSDINNRLTQAQDVRKTLCSSLRTVKYPALEEMRGKSFRHALCAAILQAILTDMEREVATADGRTMKGCPDWTKVLYSLFTKAEIDAAIRKPYAPANLKILQRLLSLVENVRVMAAYGMPDAWLSDLIRSIHAQTDLHNYQSALARNKKKSEEYQLSFDSDGLKFDTENP